LVAAICQISIKLGHQSLRPRAIHLALHLDQFSTLSSHRLLTLHVECVRKAVRPVSTRRRAQAVNGRTQMRIAGLLSGV